MDVESAACVYVYIAIYYVCDIQLIPSEKAAKSKHKFPPFRRSKAFYFFRACNFL